MFLSLSLYAARDGAGVTPGLRRRRERAERHKSFLREQEEAAANGIFAARELRESYGKYGDAIPLSLSLLFSALLTASCKTNF